MVIGVIVKTAAKLLKRKLKKGAPKRPASKAEKKRSAVRRKKDAAGRRNTRPLLNKAARDKARAKLDRAALKKRIHSLTSTFGATVKKNAKNAKADFKRRSKAAKKGARTRADRTGGPGPGSSGGF